MTALEARPDAPAQQEPVRATGVAEILSRAAASALAGTPPSQIVCPTGFTPLDDYLGGGLRGGELTLLGGPQGLGKTLLGLQMAGNVVAAGGRATVVSYEHDVEQLLERLLCMEAASSASSSPSASPHTSSPTLDDVRHSRAAEGQRSLPDRLGPAGGAAARALQSYGDRLRLFRASGIRTGIPQLRELAEQDSGVPRLVVVDYLQKVCASHIAGGEDERVTYVVESLKDLALDTGCAVLAVVAADKAGLAGDRVRLHHLRGSTALAYEADVALLLNDKFDIIARHHLMYGTPGTERFHDWVICSIEKNRNGIAAVDLEFEKDFAHGRFHPHGRVVAEVLADPRLGHE